MCLLIKCTIDLIIRSHLDLYIWKMWLRFSRLSGGGVHRSGEATRWWYGAIYLYFLPDNKDRGFV